MSRGLALGLVGVAAALTFAAPAEASLTCPDLGPVPGYGPVCTVRCLLGPNFDPTDVRGTVDSLVTTVCPD